MTKWYSMNSLKLCRQRAEKVLRQNFFSPTVRVANQWTTNEFYREVTKVNIRQYVDRECEDRDGKKPHYTSNIISCYMEKR